MQIVLHRYLAEMVVILNVKIHARTLVVSHVQHLALQVASIYVIIIVKVAVKRRVKVAVERCVEVLANMLRNNKTVVSQALTINDMS